MARGNSIHFAKGEVGIFAHNDRSSPTKNSIFSIKNNEVSCTSKEAFKTYRSELAKRSQEYTKRTKQQLQKNTATIRSAILNLEAHHTLKDLQPIVEKIEKDLDTKVIQVAIHKDEGHQEGIIDNINYHAHIEIMGLDSTGVSLAQNNFDNRSKRLDSKYYREMQDFTSQVLGMERGKRNSKAKRLDTYQYKEHAKKQAKTVKELKKEIETQRRQMAAAGIYSKEDYQALQALKKSLNKSNFQEIYQEFIALQEALQEQYEINSKDSKIAEKEIKELEEINDFKNDIIQNQQKELSEARETILKLKTTIDTQKQEKSVSRASMSDLKLKNKELQDKVTKLERENTSLKRENLSLNAERSDKEKALERELQEISIAISRYLQKNLTRSDEFVSKSLPEKIEIFAEKAIGAINSYKNAMEEQEKQLKERFNSSSDRQELRKLKNENERLSAKLEESYKKIKILETRLELKSVSKHREIDEDEDEDFYPRMGM